MRRNKKTLLIVIALVVVIGIGLGAYAVTYGPGNGSTTGQRVNSAIDNLIATGVRLLELPAFMLLAVIGIFSAAAVIVTEQLAGRFGRPNLRRGTDDDWPAAALFAGAVCGSAHRRLRKKKLRIFECQRS